MMLVIWDECVIGLDTILVKKELGAILMIISLFQKNVFIQFSKSVVPYMSW